LQVFARTSPDQKELVIATLKKVFSPSQLLPLIPSGDLLLVGATAVLMTCGVTFTWL
jgi:hypothetical protein